MCPIPEIEAALARARDKFLHRDAQLLIGNAHERTITHRIAVYLEEDFCDWHVDCEYNRQGLAMDSKSDDRGQRRFPDVIIHMRGEAGPEFNVLVLEAKPANSHPDEIEDDRHKLRSMVAAFDYQHAYQLIYSCGANGDLTFQRIGGIV